ncbi:MULTISPECIES: hypothetical protein [unclassified Archaeoglobus]|jgi:hypothetical protein|uniref:hypothetical protein n=1 Tax=unclassified Archaeoglobus TaxID=2643606 RepID=UPI0025BF1D12|nr:MULTISPECIES: hypothetical protein [unclassified Archaeoglobus]
MRKILLILAFILLIQPVIALEHLTADNFDQPETSVNPEKNYYFPGDNIQATYIITPKTDDDMELIGGEKDNPRTYTFKTSLENAQWTEVTINYYLGSWSEDVKGNEAKIDVKYFYLDEERKGVRSIEVNISGIIPQVDERIKNVIIVNVTVEDCDDDALSPLTVKVVNVERFLEDIQKLRSDADNLKLDLENAGVTYNESDFDEVYSLLDSAEKLVDKGSYVEADDKITQAENKLEDISSKADKLKAETARDYVDSVLDEAYLNLSVTEVSLNKVAESENYTLFVESYAELKSTYDELKKEFDDAIQMIEEGKYIQAYEKLTELKPKADTLLKDVNDLLSRIEGEPKGEGGFSIPFNLQFTLPFSLLYLVAIVGAAAVAIAVAIVLRRRRGKWDELR